MKQEDKDLLLEDICSRLPYGVKLYCAQGTSIDRKKGWKLVGYCEADIDIKDVIGTTVGTRHIIILNCVGPNNNVDIDFINDEVKPYLFPMSSMTKEQRKEFLEISHLENRSFYNGEKEIIIVSNEVWSFDLGGDADTEYRSVNIKRIRETIKWLNKNHFDYRGLIPKGLAIDATGLNIY